MAQKLTYVEITPEGDIIVDLKGYQGVGCEAVMKAFTEGSTVTKTTTKPEYKQKTVNLVNQ